MEGVLPFAPSLDTVGLFTERAADMAELWSRGWGGRPSGELRRAAHFRLACEGPMERAMDDAVARLRAVGVEIDEVDVPEGWTELVEAACTINTFEGARTQRARFTEFGKRIGKRLAELVRSGLRLAERGYDDARSHVEHMKAEVQAMFREYPAILSPAAMGPAPAGLGFTGDPVHNAAWTALGTPAITVPMVVDGAPLGLQMASAWGRDDALVGMAACAESLLRSG
jgi:Asp-tRNA(Asn)/Glu-tRNA(Gln) amidotransferase A subunit family amidase